ncbi:hypothetical protein ACFPT7_24700 [Acidicapsa dinghuensis]|uniref:Uncharacterized protein n=1 Tax=Acidicapsa dinghuensis TaxID=2218256 RepID=A0ABW1ENP8_9BACT|nr:hypothetical protein [Acidicapsa dinghuensis]
MADSVERTHLYHAEASALSGHLQLPFDLEIEQPASVELPEKGGYLTQRGLDYRLGSAISYKHAYTHVAGNKETKPGHGWNTLATSVIEGFNVLEVVTADRIVAQIGTDHPPEGHVPTVTFLGSRFENLRIAGHPVELDLNFSIVGDKPESDAPYTDPSSSGLLGRAAAQHARVRDQHKDYKNPIEGLLERFHLLPDKPTRGDGDEESIECSLVNQASGPFPGSCFGHVIHVPHFGTIYLAVLKVRHSKFLQKGRSPQLTNFELSMIDIDMGCIGSGKTSGATAKTNGVSGQ